MRRITVTGLTLQFDSSIKRDDHPTAKWQAEKLIGDLNDSLRRLEEQPQFMIGSGILPSQIIIGVSQEEKQASKSDLDKLLEYTDTQHEYESFMEYLRENRDYDDLRIAELALAPDEDSVAWHHTCNHPEVNHIYAVCWRLRHRKD